MPDGLSDRALDRLADALGRSGDRRGERFELHPLSRGTFTRTFRLALDSDVFFVKLASGDSTDAISAEADGLARLAEVGAVSVPAVRALVDLHGVEIDGSDSTLLVLQWLDLDRLDDRASAALGERLAALHRKATSTRHGLDRDNWIGATPQANAPTSDWTTFLFEHRLGAMIDRLAGAGIEFGPGTTPRLRAAWTAEFSGYDPEPSLLHGDLWGGNAGQRPDGAPVIFDPAVHHGDRECDLAMASLFGGFGRAFFDAYAATWPLEPGWKLRREYYQLYHVLNHALLFGGGYMADARQRIARLVGGPD